MKLSSGPVLLTAGAGYTRYYGFYTVGAGTITFVDGDGNTVPDYPVGDKAYHPIELTHLSAATGTVVYGLKGTGE